MKLAHWVTPTVLAFVLAACGTDNTSSEGGPDAAADDGEITTQNGSESDAGANVEPSEDDLGVDDEIDDAEGDDDVSDDATYEEEYGDDTCAGEPDTPAPVDPGESPDTPPDDREFEAVGTNPFVYAAHDPLSTFAADVDSASYDIFRKDIAAGNLPNPDSVRLEEFVNFFDYDYPSASDPQIPFSIALAAAPNLADNGTLLLRVGIQGKVLDDDGRKPMNLVYLVDTSGSMQAADKLPLVQRVLRDTVTLLAPTDTISIVTYAGSSGLALPATPASEAATIRDAINDFSAGGSTAGAAGIQLAYQQAGENFIEGGINHVLLCTDGDFNVGVSDTDALVELIEQERESGITFTGLGFGSDNLNDDVMESISNAGNGTYAVITDEQYAHDYVRDRLFSSLNFVAKDMKLQVEFNPDQVLAYRLLGYEDRAIADDDFRNDVVDAGEIGSGHRVTALYEVVPAGGEVPTPTGAIDAEDGEAYAGDREVEADDLVLVKVRYKNVDATAEDAAYEVNQAFAADDVASGPTALDADFQWAFAMASFAEVLKHSPYAHAENIPALAGLFTAQQQRDEERAQFVDLFEQARTLAGDEWPAGVTVPEVPEIDAGTPAEPAVDSGVDGGTEDAGPATSDVDASADASSDAG